MTTWCVTGSTSCRISLAAPPALPTTSSTGAGPNRAIRTGRWKLFQANRAAPGASHGRGRLLPLQDYPDASPHGQRTPAGSARPGPVGGIPRSAGLAVEPVDDHRDRPSIGETAAVQAHVSVARNPSQPLLWSCTGGAGWCINARIAAGQVGRMTSRTPISPAAGRTRNQRCRQDLQPPRLRRRGGTTRPARPHGHEETIPPWCRAFGPCCGNDAAQLPGRSPHRHAISRASHQAIPEQPQPTPQGEHQMPLFVSAAQLQTFRLRTCRRAESPSIGRHLLRSAHHRLLRTPASVEWAVFSASSTSEDVRSQVGKKRVSSTYLPAAGRSKEGRMR